MNISFGCACAAAGRLAASHATVVAAANARLIVFIVCPLGSLASNSPDVSVSGIRTLCRSWAASKRAERLCHHGPVSRCNTKSEPHTVVIAATTGFTRPCRASYHEPMTRRFLGSQPLKGRGALSNPHVRFDSNSVEKADDGWYQEEEGVASLPETVLPDRAKSVIATNDSPDVGFEQ